MKELSRATAIDLGAAPARETPRAAAAPPTTLTVRKSRRVVIASSDRWRWPVERGMAPMLGEPSDRVKSFGHWANLLRHTSLRGGGQPSTSAPPHRQGLYMLSRR